MADRACMAAPTPDPAGAVRRTIKAHVVGQFRRPHGFMGRIAGWVMATRASNRRRNLWTVTLMGIQPSDHVLEIGYGPGYALSHVCGALTDGKAVGIDLADTMYTMACLRNRKAIERGSLSLFVGSVGDESAWRDPALAGPFDHIFAVNVAMFWQDPADVIATLADRLAPRGRLYLTFQPRLGDRSDAGALASAQTMADQMRAAGLTDVHFETLAELSPMAVCVIGSKPGHRP